MPLFFALSIISVFGSGVALAEGVDLAAKIAPVVDPGERRATLASLPYSERVRLCRGSLNAVVLDATATISGPVRRQVSNAQHAGIALAKAVEAWYAGRPGATSHIRDTLQRGAAMQAFTRLAPYSPPEYRDYNLMN
ncbi:MAG: hypothetical protein F4158_09790 [Synechococcus sp. SB0675_bin_7]|nr:hypothetical protein [Synechococcus sp. SB0675_bin_7]